MAFRANKDSALRKDYVCNQGQPIFDNIWGPFRNFLANKDLSHLVEPPGEDP